MIIVVPSVELLGFTTINQKWSSTEPCSDGARLIERAGRVCWKSEGKTTAGSAGPFCERVLRQFGHESIAEHASATIHFVTDRIVSHQLVRHRIAAYSQESTHYLNYSKDTFDRSIRVCKPWDLQEGTFAYEIWHQAMCHAEAYYFQLMEVGGLKHYEARYVLPMGLKTELVATYNFRTWKHVLKTRTEMRADGKPKNTPEVHDLMLKAGDILAKLCPEIFGEWERGN